MLNAYYTQILTVLGINAILALGLNLILGVAGQFSLGHAAFMSIGAYVASLMTLQYHTPFAVSLLAGGLAASAGGVLIGYPTLRLWGDYLAIATLGFSEILRIVLLNLDVTGGALGLSGIPQQTSLGWVAGVFLLTLLAVVRLQRSRLGRALLAIREDEIAAECLGIRLTTYKLQAFGVSAFFAGVGGGLYAHLISFISPGDFGISKMIEMLDMVVLGGMGSVAGSILGASLMTLAPEVLRFMASYRMIVFGALLVLMMVFRPNGLLGDVRLSANGPIQRLLRRLRPASGGEVQ